MSELPDYPLVLVTWLDSQGTGHWQSLEDACRIADEDHLVHYSVGFLIDDEAGPYVLVAASYHQDSRSEMVADVMQIPRVAVLKVEALKPARRSTSTSTARRRGQRR